MVQVSAQKHRRAARAALSALLVTASFPVLPAYAQTPSLTLTQPLGTEDEIAFEADALNYDSSLDQVTATGRVVVRRDGHTLTADRVTYDRKAGTVSAQGQVQMLDPDGNRLTAGSMTLTESLHDGVVENILLLLDNGGRLGAISGTRTGQRIQLRRASYTPCALCDGQTGRPIAPSWLIKADKVTYDQQKQRVFYQDATFEVLGVPVAYTPFLSHPGPGVAKASGLLSPDFRQSQALGFGITLPYFWAINDQSDLRLAPTFYTRQNPRLAGEYRQHIGSGPLRVGGDVTVASRRDGAGQLINGDALRGYFYADGQFQHSPRWRSSLSGQVTLDDTYLRIYDIRDDDRLRSAYALEYFGDQDYLSVQTMAFQGLRQTDSAGLSPFALPQISYRYRSQPGASGGVLSARADALALIRTSGMDTYRLSGQGGWSRETVTPTGQRLELSADLRGDLYYANETDRPDQPPVYAGKQGFSARLLPRVAGEISWPFAGPLFSGMQTLAPMAQLVLTPDGGNGGFPNEDSRAIDLDDANLFSLDRFAGVDRWESGPRITLGSRWRYISDALDIAALVGQSFRLEDAQIFPDGTGLSGNISDFVGRTEIRWHDWVDFTHRYRLDRDSLAIRRNEVDASFGPSEYRLTIGYALLNRNIAVEDLEDREELRLGARARLNRHWSLAGRTIVDLTGRNESALAASDGFDPIRHRVELSYEDECFDFSIAYRRNFTQDRDFERETAFIVRFGLKTLSGH